MIFILTSVDPLVADKTAAFAQDVETALQLTFGENWAPDHDDDRQVLVFNDSLGRVVKYRVVSYPLIEGVIIKL